jgi:hypothetical protein
MVLTKLKDKMKIKNEENSLIAVRNGEIQSKCGLQYLILNRLKLHTLSVTIIYCDMTTVLILP